jgi:hypothetical protein
VSDILKKPDVLRAIELYALKPEITAKEVAQEVGVSKDLVYIWRKNPKFVDAIYERYMIQFGTEIPGVLQAMIREAKAGNVQAGRLILEHSGKLIKNVNITIDSPYEKFLKSKTAEIEYEDAEVEEIVDSIPDIEVNLPERDTQDQRKRTQEEKKRIKKLIDKKNKEAPKSKEYNKRRKEWYKWKKRAEKVGIDPLPARRPTPAQRKAWQNEIETKEKQQR